MDQEDICRRLPGIEKDEEHLLLWHYGRRSAVDRNDGMIRAVSDDRAVDIMPKLNIYTLFWYAKEDVSLTGDWIPLEKAVESLRGVRVSSTGFQLLAFYRMPVKLNFWDADDEFPAQANMLFDSSATDLAHVESIVTIATEALYQLADVSGVPMKGSPFYRF